MGRLLKSWLYSENGALKQSVLAREWLYFAGSLTAGFALAVWDDHSAYLVFVYPFVQFVRLTAWALRVLTSKPAPAEAVRKSESLGRGSTGPSAVFRSPAAASTAAPVSTNDTPVPTDAAATGARGISKRCPMCNLPNRATAAACLCGYNFALATGGQHSPSIPVGGWLLLLCILLTIVQPFLIFGVMFAQLTYAANLIQVGLIVIWNVSLSIWSFYAGSALWQRREGAIRTAKIFLAGSLAANVVLVVLAMVLELGSGDARFVGGGLLSALVWLAYLEKSERVRRTYPYRRRLGTITSASVSV